VYLLLQMFNVAMAIYVVHFNTFVFNRIVGVIVSVLTVSPDQVKPNTMKLVFVASLLSTQL